MDTSDDIAINTSLSGYSAIASSVTSDLDPASINNSLSSQDAIPVLPSTDVILDNAYSGMQDVTKTTLDNKSLVSGKCGSQEVSSGLQESTTEDLTPHDLALSTDNLYPVVIIKPNGRSGIDFIENEPLNLVAIPSPSHISDSPNTVVPDRSVQVLQDVTNLITGTQDATNRKNDRVNRVKRNLKSLGLSDSIYSSNSDSYYPVLSVDQGDNNYLSFHDILDKTWTISLEKLSSNDVAKEQEFLKQTTFSPKSKHETESSSDSNTSSEPFKDDVKSDPNYGIPIKRKKISLRPGRQPSASRIAAQQIINKTKGNPLPSLLVSTRSMSKNNGQNIISSTEGSTPAVTLKSQDTQQHITTSNKAQNLPKNALTA